MVGDDVERFERSGGSDGVGIERVLCLGEGRGCAGHVGIPVNLNIYVCSFTISSCVAQSFEVPSVSVSCRRV